MITFTIINQIKVSEILWLICCKGDTITESTVVYFNMVFKLLYYYQSILHTGPRKEAVTIETRIYLRECININLHHCQRCCSG